MVKTPDQIRAKDRERKARKRQALRKDPEKWQAEAQRARDANRRYRMGYSTPSFFTRLQTQQTVFAEGGAYVYVGGRDYSACLGLLTMAGTA